jgi:hypothetical protein
MLWTRSPALAHHSKVPSGKTNRYGRVNETKSYTDMNVRWMMRVMWTVIMQMSKDAEPIQRLKRGSQLNTERE